MMISKDLIPDLMNFIPTHSFFHEEVLKFEVPKKKDKATEKLKNSKKVPIEKSQELMIRRCSSIDRISSNSQKKKSPGKDFVRFNNFRDYSGRTQDFFLY